ncbi:MAG: ATP-binding cassette domain-containing protein, partial [Rickettsiales bacterium]|nr:ATP-binding cassette domain-containing protein [Rickettsiales bacterium]
MENAIEIRELRKTYRDKKGNDKEALKGVNLSIPKGSFFGLLGPNGAGKSTLINIMAGLVIKTSGDVAVMGHDIVKDMRKARTSLGVVPQELVLDT